MRLSYKLFHNTYKLKSTVLLSSNTFTRFKSIGSFTGLEISPKELDVFAYIQHVVFLNGDNLNTSPIQQNRDTEGRFARFTLH